MQQPGQMFPVMPSYPPANITTEQIQKYLDENKKLILAILDNQNLGKLAECAQYQAQLQKNLMYLAAIADAQPQTPTMPTQMSPHPAMQQGGFYMQHPQAAAMVQQQQQQQGIFSTPRPLFSNNPHQLQEHQPHPQGQMSMRSSVAGPNNGANNETNLGNKQDKPDGRTAPSSDGHGNSAVGGDGDEAK